MKYGAAFAAAAKRNSIGKLSSPLLAAGGGLNLRR
jgi:hypothetical protein